MITTNIAKPLWGFAEDLYYPLIQALEGPR
jgi:hypothetical protein